MKHNLNFRQFPLRENGKVKIEQNMLSVVYNLKIIWRNLKGKLERLDEIGSLARNSGAAQGSFTGFRPGNGLICPLLV